MTDVTILGRWQMIDGFPVEPAGDRTELTTVATFTTAGDALMNRRHKRCRCKHRCGIVTDTAVALCWDMNIVTRHAGFSGCDTRVMAGRTVVVVNAKVVKGNTCKGRKVVGDVARRTVRTRRYVT